MAIRPYGRSCFRDSIIENFGTSYKLAPAWGKLIEMSNFCLKILVFRVYFKYFSILTN
jgi:hypothetical protein